MSNLEKESSSIQREQYDACQERDRESFKDQTILKLISPYNRNIILHALSTFLTRHHHLKLYTAGCLKPSSCTKRSRPSQMRSLQHPARAPQNMTKQNIQEGNNQVAARDAFLHKIKIIPTSPTYLRNQSVVF